MSDSPKKPETGGSRDWIKAIYSEPAKKISERLRSVRRKILIMSGKGGVGKTTVTVNLAAALAWKKYKVGILDADLHGPNVPKMLGAEGSRPRVLAEGMLPMVGPLSIRVMSMAFFLESTDIPIIWRGPLKMKALQQFLSDVAWGELDYLLVDSPPGTGDEPLSVMQLIPGLDGAIIVTTPQSVALLDSRKAVSMAKKLDIPVLGIVENMSGYTCPKCGDRVHIFGKGGGERAAKELKISFLGSLPIDVRIREEADRGRPFIVAHPDSEAAKSFMESVDKIEAQLKRV